VLFRSRRSWARNDEAIFAVKRAMADNSNLQVTLPNKVEKNKLQNIINKNN